MMRAGLDWEIGMRETQGGGMDMDNMRKPSTHIRSSLSH